jgi:hypothetical protein
MLMLHVDSMLGECGKGHFFALAENAEGSTRYDGDGEKMQRA